MSLPKRAELSAKTSTDERYVREWLASQAAGGYVTYDDKSQPAEMKRAMADKAHVEGLTDSVGDRIFPTAAFVPITSPD